MTGEEDSGGDVRLLHGDCLEIMPRLFAGSVDLVCADLPFQITSCAWDTLIPFAPLWAQYKRLLKPGGAVVLFGSQPFTSALVTSNPRWFRYDLVWQKSNPSGFLDANRKPLRAHESILVFAEGRHTYNPQFWYVPEDKRDKRQKRIRKEEPQRVYSVRKETVRREDDGRRYPLSILSVPSAWGKKMHPTQKPVALLEYLVKTYTNEGELVLDNTAGSFTTGVACVNTGRRFIGIEKSAEYFNIGRERVARARGECGLFAEPEAVAR